MLNDDTVLNKWAEETVKAGGSTDKDNLLRQYRNYRGWLTGNDSVPYAELFLATDNRIHFDLWNLLPFTQGYVKILDNVPYLRSFEYNPRYFQNELVLAGQAAASRLARKLTRSREMVKHFDSEMLPGTDAMPDNATLEDWKNYARQNFRANYHGVGTCSMMKKEYGGVVDNTAKVYGARNLRVDDGSIPPTQVSSHVMTVYYAMAVRIAEAILEVHGHV
jgi:choline dehydrogenase-like flavoprotein